MIINNAYIIDNVAEYLGGAIYTTGDVDLTIDFVEFINNYAIDGGAIKIKVIDKILKNLNLF